MTTTASSRDKILIVVHLNRGDRRFIDRNGQVWPRAKCGIVLQRLHHKSDSLLDTTCADCLQAVAYRPYVRLPYKE